MLQSNEILRDLLAIRTVGKRVFDGLHHNLGRMLVETIFCMGREELISKSAQDGEKVYSWGYQNSSVFVGDAKQLFTKPRAKQKDGSEVLIPSYEKLRENGVFSEELLVQMMAGLSARQYKANVVKAAEAFGVSPSSVSRHFVKASAKKLKEFVERDISDFKPFAILLDAVHRGGIASIMAPGIDTSSHKKVLGYWEGSIENATITGELLADLERRKLILTSGVIFITDGGKGIIAA